MAGTASLASPSAPPARAPLPTRDKVTIGLLAFFILVAWTLEAYWVLHNDSMEGRHDLLARALSVYWPADRTYRIAGHGTAKSFTLALESVNSFATPWLQLWLIWAVVRGKHYRHVLQLTVATYTFYGTFLYFYVAHLSGYAIFEYRGVYPFAMFYGINAPWFIAYAWLMYDSIRALCERLRAAAPA